MDMNLIQKNQNKYHTPIVPPSGIDGLAEQGKALIILQHDFDKRYVPKGYTKLTLKTPVDTFYALIPQQALFYLDKNNLGDGTNIEEGLDILSELYDEILAASDIFGQGEELKVGGADLAVTVRSNYKVLLSNSLIRNEPGQGSEKDVKAVYNQKEMDRLCLANDYVDIRMRAIAAIIQGKSPEEIRESDLREVLGYEKELEITQHLTRLDLGRIASREGYQTRPQSDKHMRCTGESYFYLKEDFRDGQDGWDYDLSNMTRTRSEITAENIKKISDLEGEINTYQRNSTADGLSPHDISRTRQFMNIKYQAGLNIEPKRPAKD